MDPFPITSGAIALATLASTACLELKMVQHAAIKSPAIRGMLADLKDLRLVLQSIEDRVEDLDSQAPLTGDIGALWSALKATLQDGCDLISMLIVDLVALNQEMQDLTKMGCIFRLKRVNHRIVLLGKHIEEYKHAFQSSVEAIVLFQQTTMKGDTSTLIPSSDGVHQVPMTLNTNMITLSAKQLGLDLVTVDRLMTTVQTAKTVIANASANSSHVTEEQAPESFEVSSESDRMTEMSAPRGDMTPTWNAPQNFEHWLSSRSSVCEPSETKSVGDPTPQQAIPKENKTDETQMDVTRKVRKAENEGRTLIDRIWDIIKAIWYYVGVPILWCVTRCLVLILGLFIWTLVVGLTKEILR